MSAQTAAWICVAIVALVFGVPAVVDLWERLMIVIERRRWERDVARVYAELEEYDRSVKLDRAFEREMEARA